MYRFRMQFALFGGRNAHGVVECGAFSEFPKIIVYPFVARQNRPARGAHGFLSRQNEKTRMRAAGFCGMARPAL